MKKLFCIILLLCTAYVSAEEIKQTLPELSTEKLMNELNRRITEGRAETPPAVTIMFYTVLIEDFCRANSLVYKTSTTIGENSIYISAANGWRKETSLQADILLDRDDKALAFKLNRFYRNLKTFVELSKSFNETEVIEE